MAVFSGLFRCRCKNLLRVNLQRCKWVHIGAPPLVRAPCHSEWVGANKMVTCKGFWIGCLDLMTTCITRLGTTSNYSATANLRNSQFNIPPAKLFPACCVFTSRSLATASNSGDSSASRSQALPSPTLVHNCLPGIPSTELDCHLFWTSLAELNCTQLLFNCTQHWTVR
jgi:hypothetical protein